jgi:hypothetical protein
VSQARNRSPTKLTRLNQSIACSYHTVNDLSQLNSKEWGAWNYIALGLGALGIVLIIILIIYFGKRIMDRAKQLKEEDKLKDGIAQTLVDAEEQAELEDAKPLLAEIIYSDASGELHTPIANDENSEASVN